MLVARMVSACDGCCCCVSTEQCVCVGRALQKVAAASAEARAAPARNAKSPSESAFLRANAGVQLAEAASVEKAERERAARGQLVILTDGAASDPEDPTAPSAKEEEIRSRPRRPLRAHPALVDKRRVLAIVLCFFGRQTMDWWRVKRQKKQQRPNAKHATTSKRL